MERIDPLKTFKGSNFEGFFPIAWDEANRLVLQQPAERGLQEGEQVIVVLIYGICWCFHVAFREPQFAADYADMGDWKKATHRMAAKPHPLTIIQNSITSFEVRMTLLQGRVVFDALRTV